MEPQWYSLLEAKEAQEIPKRLLGSETYIWISHFAKHWGILIIQPVS